MIINHNCCIKLVPLVILIYDARSHIRHTRCLITPRYPTNGKEPEEFPPSEIRCTAVPLARAESHSLISIALTNTKLLHKLKDMCKL